jgi:hypothetical protein
LINCYLDNFKKTPLHFMPSGGVSLPQGALLKGTDIAASWPDGTTTGGSHYVGYRFDCWGDADIADRDVNIWGQTNRWSHMFDSYPREIAKSGLADSWKKAPITMEICGTFMRWIDEYKFDDKVVAYIFDEAVKLHVSSFNAKSALVPDHWSPLVDKWLNRMGYRFVLRQFIYPSYVCRQGQLSFASLWENVGCAPIYKDYQLAVRLRNTQKTLVLPATTDVRQWLPGDIICDEKLYIPYDMPLGKYQLEIAIASPVSFEPRVKLAIEGKTDDGWYRMGEIEVKETK